MRVEVMLYVYLFVCTAMIAFNIVMAVLFRRREQRTEMVSEGLHREVLLRLKAAKEYAPTTEEHRQYLSQKLRRVGNMIAFDEMLEAEYISHPKEIQSYLHSLDDVFESLMMHYAKKDRMEAAYFAYIIKKYRLLQERSIPLLENALFALLKESDIYCRENAMQALYTTGDVECVLKAVKIIDESDLFFHRKLLSDGLLNFSGSSHALGMKIMQSFFDFSPEMQVALLDYLRFSGDEYREFALSLLQNEKNSDEVRYSAIRYLGKYALDEAYETLCRLATEKTELKWQYAAIASAALRAYPGEKTIDILKENLHSQNWYIRFDSAKSLKNLGIRYSEIIDVMDGNDRYAAEIMEYFLQEEDTRGKGAVQS